MTIFDLNDDVESIIAKHLTSDYKISTIRMCVCVFARARLQTRAHTLTHTHEDTHTCKHRHASSQIVDLCRSYFFKKNER